jgi:hypothetical protein
MKKLLADCINLLFHNYIGEPNWTALRKAIEEEEENIQGNWGDRIVPEK